MRALQQASRDGVDVRLLVPGSSDVPAFATLSRALYRPLLEAGVRVFEWNGSMIHSKTAVADGQWTRVGSTNLNIASWVGNWELDVTIENAAIAREMEEQYVRDLEGSTEIVASDLDHPLAGAARSGLRRPQRRDIRSLVSRGAVGVAGQALRLGSGIGGAVAGRRALDDRPSVIPLIGGLLLVGLAAMGLTWPMALAVPVVIGAGLLGIGLVIQELASRLARG